MSKLNLTFTLEFQNEWADSKGHDMQLGVPLNAVIGLLSLSDLFVLPSLSEGCSLVMLEAAITKNLLILNDDVESLHEFGGPRIEPYASIRSLYFSFGSLTRALGNYLPDEATWYMDHARLLMDMQTQDRSLMFFRHVRKKHNPNWVYKQQLLPVLEEKCRELTSSQGGSVLSNHEVEPRAEVRRKEPKKQEVSI